MFLKSPKQTIQIEDTPFTKGGKGSVYTVVGKPDMVAKLYHSSGQTKEKKQKILAMLASPPKRKVTGQIAWLIDILYVPVHQLIDTIKVKNQNLLIICFKNGLKRGKASLLRCLS